MMMMRFVLLSFSDLFNFLVPFFSTVGLLINYREGARNRRQLSGGIFSFFRLKRDGNNFTQKEGMNRR